MDNSNTEIIKSGWFYMSKNQSFDKKFARMTHEYLILSDTDKANVCDTQCERFFLGYFMSVQCLDNHSIYYSIKITIGKDPPNEIIMHFLTNSVRKSWMNCLQEIIKRTSQTANSGQNSEDKTIKNMPTYSSQESLFEDTHEGCSYYYDNQRNSELSEAIMNPLRKKSSSLTNKKNATNEISILRRKIIKQNESISVKRKIIENIKEEYKQARQKSEMLASKICEISIIQKNLKQENDSLREKLLRKERQNSELTQELCSIKFEMHKMYPLLLETNSQSSMVDVLRETHQERVKIRNKLVNFKSFIERNFPENSIEESQNLDEFLETSLNQTARILENSFSEIDSAIRNSNGSVNCESDSLHGISCLKCLQLGLGLLVCFKHNEVKQNSYKDSLLDIASHLKDHIRFIIFSIYNFLIRNNNLKDCTVTRERFSLLLNERITSNWINKGLSKQGKRIESSFISKMNGESYKIIIQILLLDDCEMNMVYEDVQDKSITEYFDELTQILIPSLALIRIAYNYAEENCHGEILVEIQNILQAKTQLNNQQKFTGENLVTEKSLEETSFHEQKLISSYPTRSHSFSISRFAPIKKRHKYLENFKPHSSFGSSEDLNYVITAMQRLFIEERNSFIVDLNESWIPKSYFNVYAEETKIKMNELEMKVNQILDEIDNNERSKMIEEIFLTSYKRIEDKLEIANKLTHKEMFNEKNLLFSDSFPLERSLTNLVNENISIAAAMLRCSLDEIQFLSHLQSERIGNKTE